MNFYRFQKIELRTKKMELFNGGVKEAIAEAKAKKTVFVVIVTGLKTPPPYETKYFRLRLSYYEV